MDKLCLYIPRAEELGFYRALLADPATMAYNAAWFPPEGCIPFPESAWADWHRHWVGQEPRRFFAYLQREADGAFVGYVNAYQVPERDWWDIGVLISASRRGKDYGWQGLGLLLDRAFRAEGVSRLHNVFEPERAAALHLHKALGFREIGREDGLVHLLLTREDWLRDRARAQNKEEKR